MLRREWPLIVFTIAGQAAAGAFCAAAVLIFVFAGRAPGPASLVLDGRLLGGIAALLMLGGMASFFHLGSPRRAALALRNLRSSWLSREILSEILFLFLLAILLFLILLNTGGPRLFRAVLVAAVADALFFIFSMSRIYRLETVPAWRNVHTPLSFFLSSALLGCLGAASALGWFWGEAYSFDPGGSQDKLSSIQILFHMEKALAAAALAAIALSLIVVVVLTPEIGVFGSKKPTLRKLPPSAVRRLLLARIPLLLAAAVVLIKFLGSAAPESAVQAAPFGFLILAFFLALGAEVSGRFLFYSLYSRIGV